MTLLPLPGIVDDLTAAGVTCFGPSAKAAQLEASKSFSKAFMERHGIPTARYGSFSDPEEACSYIRTSVRTRSCSSSQLNSRLVDGSLIFQSHQTQNRKDNCLKFYLSVP